MEAKFTPGPWLCDDFGMEFDGARFGEVAFVLSKDGESFDAVCANACLISAAPDMYEALEQSTDDLIEWLEWAKVNKQIDRRSIGIHQRQIDRNHDILAKARGEIA